ncbi:hypothetical protein GS429_20085 [Natronorubrum sp. JWXQ-INN-674]|uniref:Uncharacterized protein n=1 Tax=Natronorubrum halalkaliphilum TaxID=2691917 RepID=A0A6B0VS94_9EURY|nr:hypothetical protein [Natronorubrum halalkaliphilum]MXV64324.1 hypothetical protein [Natronorubrum halalkaliphilum]
MGEDGELEWSFSSGSSIRIASHQRPADSSHHSGLGSAKRTEQQRPARQIGCHVLEGRLDLAPENDEYELRAGGVNGFDGAEMIFPEAQADATAFPFRHRDRGPTDQLLAS